MLPVCLEYQRLNPLALLIEWPGSGGLVSFVPTDRWTQTITLPLACTHAQSNKVANYNTREGM